MILAHDNTPKIIPVMIIGDLIFRASMRYSGIAIR